MTGRLEMYINGKLNLKRDVFSFAYIDKLKSEWKAQMIPALANSDSWEIVLVIKSELVKRQTT